MSRRKSHQHAPAAAAPARVRRGYFECRYGQLHVHQAIPGGGGFEEGPALLALHAAAYSGGMFAGLLSALGRDRSAFAPDLPGFGASEAPDGLSIAQHTAAIGDFLDMMRLRQVDVLGCGLGVPIALELAATHPAVRRVVIAALGASDGPALPRSADAADAFLGSQWAGARRDCGADAPLEAIVAACAERLRNAAGSAHAAAAERDYPLRERLSGISQPLLVLHPAEGPRGLGLSGVDVPAQARRTPCADIAELQAAPEPLVAAIRDFLTH
jgi:pimeloyl-ACP methyl ester carboxylesterase